MVLCYPSTPGRLALTAGCFLGGVSLMVVGMHLSYKNVAPQRARTIARDDYVRAFLTRKYGYDFTKPGYKRRRF